MELEAPVGDFCDTLDDLEYSIDIFPSRQICYCFGRDSYLF